MSLRSIVAGTTTACLVLIAGCGEQGQPEPVSADQPPVGHAHGLAADPAANVLYLATHTGLFRLHAQSPPSRVSTDAPDLMGFAVAGPGRFIASGHPDLTQALPAHLGLVESRDGGRSWTPVSLLGQADFHVLEPIGERIYGYDSLAGRIRVTDDGRTWRDGASAPITDLLADPSDAASLLVATSAGLRTSSDAGRTLTPVAGPDLRLLARSGNAVIGLASSGAVYRQEGSSWTMLSRLPGEPAALTAAVDVIHVALADGSVLSSFDKGYSWTSFRAGR